MNRRETLKRISMLTLGAISGTWAGCRTKPQREKINSFSALALQLIAQLAETVIPETDTPGAKAAGVAEFVIRALRDCYRSKERENFIRGLDEFEESCHARFGHSFLLCAPAQQLSIVEKLDQEALGFIGKMKARILGRDHFFRILKLLSLIGYFTSRQGATQALAYDPIPGTWTGCTVMKPGQKGWAT